MIIPGTVFRFAAQVLANVFGSVIAEQLIKPLKEEKGMVEEDPRQLSLDFGENQKLRLQPIKLPEGSDKIRGRRHGLAYIEDCGGSPCIENNDGTRTYLSVPVAESVSDSERKEND